MANIVLRATKGAALTWTEADDNFSNLNSAKLEAVSDDTAPSLGGDLDLAGNRIVAGEDGVIGLDGVVEIGSIDIGDETFVSVVNADAGADALALGVDIVNSAETNAVLLVTADNVVIEVAETQIAEFGGTGITLNGLIYPSTDGTAGQVLTTDGDGTLSFTTPSGGGIASVSEDTDPSLGGDLSVAGNRIVAGEDGIIGLDGIVEIGAAFEADPDVFISVINGDPAGAAFIIGYDLANETDPGASIDIGSSSIAFVINEDDALKLTGSQIIAGQTITSAAGADLVLTPSTDQKTSISKLTYSEVVYSLGTTSGTVAPDAANGPVQTVTLNGNLTLNAFTNPVAGQSITLIVNTGGTGRTLTSSMKWAGGEKTLSTTSTTDIISVFYDGTNYWASLSKDFK